MINLVLYKLTFSPPLGVRWGQRWSSLQTPPTNFNREIAITFSELFISILRRIGLFNCIFSIPVLHKPVSLASLLSLSLHLFLYLSVSTIKIYTYTYHLNTHTHTHTPSYVHIFTQAHNIHCLKTDSSIRLCGINLGSVPEYLQTWAGHLSSLSSLSSSISRSVELYNPHCCRVK